METKMEEVKEDILEILYKVYEECGDMHHVNEHGFNEGHYLIQDITERIESYFKKINN